MMPKLEEEKKFQTLYIFSVVFFSSLPNDWVDELCLRFLQIPRHFNEKSQEREEVEISTWVLVKIAKLMFSWRFLVLIIVRNVDICTNTRFLSTFSFIHIREIVIFLMDFFCVKLRTMHFTGWSFEPIKNARRRPRGLNSMGFTRQITIRHKIRFSVVSLLFFSSSLECCDSGVILRRAIWRSWRRNTHILVCAQLSFSCLSSPACAGPKYSATTLSSTLELGPSPRVWN